MKRAFTLIELLIVVAIIAILAAIAVPNFLEAQVRSKVSKCKADMRSLATALESYMVDHNKYPFDRLSCSFPWYITDVISTPIAYMTSVSYDLFTVGSQSARSTTWAGPNYQFLGKKYRYVNIAANPVDAASQWRNCWTPTGTGGSAAGGLFAVTMTQAGIDSFQNAYGGWKLQSMGPDKLDTDIVDGVSYFIAGSVMVYYDPTNGTNSVGDIILTQKGMK